MKKKLLYVIGIILVITVLISLYDTVRPKHNEFVKVADMNYQRVGHSATLLKNGNVLIVGGRGTGKGLNIAEIYNPQTNKFELAGKLNTTREAHSATLLKNGNIFISGGKIGLGMKYLKFSEEYYYKTNKFKLLNNMIYRRINHTATLLKNGNVILIGGETLAKNKNNDYYNSLITDSVEVYYPNINKFELINKLNKPRVGHTATLLNDGTVLVIGGDKEGTVEIYNPQTNEFKLISKLNIPRVGHTAYLLKNGTVVVIGGDKEGTVEIYNPETKKFQLAGKLIETGRRGFATALLDDDSILIIGGTKPHSWGYVDLNSSEIYKSREQKSYKGPNIKIARSYPTATKLSNGNVLVCGGTDTYFRHKSSCELYKK